MTLHDRDSERRALESIAHFDKHPVTVPMTKEEVSGFRHL
jgi:hypothetical protein